MSVLRGMIVDWWHARSWRPPENGARDRKVETLRRRAIHSRIATEHTYAVVDKSLAATRRVHDRMDPRR